MDKELAIECIKTQKQFVDDMTKEAFDMAIKALSAEAEVKYIAQVKVDLEEIVRRIKEEYEIVDDWIPCSERLPVIGKEVLLSEPNAMFIAEYHGSGDSEGLWLVDGCHHYLADVNGCAWMSLPAPYKGGER